MPCRALPCASSVRPSRAPCWASRPFHLRYERANYTFPVKRLDGRVAIITGGGHGIGRAYAQRLAEEGAKIVIAELDGPAGERVAAEGGGLPVRTHVGNQKSAHEMALRTLQRLRPNHVLGDNCRHLPDDP